MLAAFVPFKSSHGQKSARRTKPVPSFS